MIWVKAGGECTQLFDSYHPLRTRAVLEKYCIGEVKRVSGDERKIIVYESEQKGDFTLSANL